jgi:hypothetical protein
MGRKSFVDLYEVPWEGKPRCFATVPVGGLPMMRATLITCTGSGQFSTIQAWDTVAPRLLNFAEHARFQF